MNVYYERTCVDENDLIIYRDQCDTYQEALTDEVPEETAIVLIETWEKTHAEIVDRSKK